MTLKNLTTALVFFGAGFFNQAAWADMTEIPVPIVTVQAGEKIYSSSLKMKSFYVSDIAASLFATTKSEIDGRVAKRALLQGKPIALFYLKPIGLVEIGVPTKVTLESNGIAITALLVPVQNGVAGQIIDARNPDSGKVVKVLVTEDGQLQVPVP
jgi:flagellar basal body P-ring formation protein FlgA